MNSVYLSQSLKQNQQLLINLAMKQAFHVLQLPALELSEWLKTEIESNPVLEIDLTKESFKESLQEPVYRRKMSESTSYQKREEPAIRAEVSLYEHLMQQAHLTLEDRGDLNIAEWLIGHFNEKGFLDIPLDEVASNLPLASVKRILAVIQTFDPPGVGACSLQESLLIQLGQRQNRESLAGRILSEHFDDLLHNRLPLIAEKLGVSTSRIVSVVEKEIAPLNLHPGSGFSSERAPAIIPDLLLIEAVGKWHIEVNTTFLPNFQIAPIYVEAIQEKSLENTEYAYLRQQLSGGRWLKRIVHRRNQMLKSIGEFVLKKQIDFFNAEKGELAPLTLQEAARELNLNESTVARAVSGKYIACPQGVFSLKSFFHQGVTAKNGQKISNHSLRQILAKAIANEDKRSPLSDAELAQHFHRLGIPCARRTIAKYRTTLKIAPAARRKKW